MIKLVRVDHRLLHGQVVFSWTTNLNVDCILVANDEVFNDSVQMMALKMAKPTGVKLVIKNMDDSIAAINSGVTDKYKLFVVTNKIADAYRLAKECGIQSINLGGTKALEGTKNISKAINVFPDEEIMLDELIEKGVEVEIRMVPTDTKLNYINCK